MKDKLVKLLLDVDYTLDTDGRKARDSAEFIAEYLLSKDVILPPLKCGQTVYVINSLFVSEYSIKKIAYDGIFFRFYCENEKYAIECRNFMFFDERIGKTVFLTQEAAEQALKGGA